MTDYLPPEPKEVVTRILGELLALRWEPGEQSQPGMATGAALMHVCHLLESIQRLHDEGRTIEAEILVRAHFEIAVATIYLAHAPAAALSYMSRASVRTMSLMQEELGSHDSKVTLENKRLRRLAKRRDEQNAGIEAKNDREGTGLPLRPPVPDADGVLFRFDVKPIIESLTDGEATDDYEPFSVPEVIARIKALTSKETVPLDLMNFYRSLYRGLSMNAVHPTATVLARYVVDEDTWRLKPDADLNADHGLVQFAVFMTLLSAERVLEAFGLDATWYSGHLALVVELMGETNK